MSIRTLLAAGLIGWAASATPGLARANEDARFVLENAGNQPIAALWISAAGYCAWCSDLLQDRVLAPGQSITITPGGAGCRFDVRVQFQDGAQEVHRDIDLCRLVRLRVGASGRGGVAP